MRALEASLGWLDLQNSTGAQITRMAIVALRRDVNALQDEVASLRGVVDHRRTARGVPMKLGRESLAWHIRVREYFDTWDYSMARLPVFLVNTWHLCAKCGHTFVEHTRIRACGKCLCDGFAQRTNP